MKKIQIWQNLIVVCVFALVSHVTNAQVKIGNNPTTLNPGAILEMESVNRGLLLPRVALANTTLPDMGPTGNTRLAVIGMQVYNTNASIVGSATYPANGVGLYTFDGTGWVYGSIPIGGATGQVLSKTATGLSWAAPANGVSRYTLGSTSGAGAIVKATGAGITLTIDNINQTAIFNVPLGVELLSIRLWEMSTSNTGSYGMSTTASTLKIKIVHADPAQATSFTNTVLPQLNTLLHTTAISPYYMDAKGTLATARKYELEAAPAANSFTIRVPLMDPSSLGQVGWSILLNF